ncbi:MAG: DUF4335 domain-containing protein [Synechococcus sp.]|nr:DUF4335 domain-containing protein [Synechococcus sp.]
MLKTVHRYQQTAARLEVEGYPDLSAGQDGDTIGILSGWRLQLVGAPELEGTRDHLEALMAAVMPYARHRLSDVERRFGGRDGFVEIGPNGDGHQLELHSSREGVKSLQLQLDDAELSDLVRCLDRLRLDQRVPLAWTFPPEQPLTRRELTETIPLQQRFGPAVLGGLLLATTAWIAVLVPLPERPTVDVIDAGSRIETNEQ